MCVCVPCRAVLRHVLCVLCCAVQDWEEEQKRRQEALTKGWNPDGDSEPEEEEDKDDGLPFACYICRWGAVH